MEKECGLEVNVIRKFELFDKLSWQTGNPSLALSSMWLSFTCEEDCGFNTGVEPIYDVSELSQESVKARLKQRRLDCLSNVRLMKQ